MSKTIKKQYKCQHCQEFKDAKAFYTSHTGRASPYCIECNPDATLLTKYTREARRLGSKAFSAKIENKERQLRLMLQAASEV
jgi:hypothetical protein